MAAPTTQAVEYPDGDGQPMAENTLQFRWIVTIQGNLDAMFFHRPDVFVAGDLLWYPVEGDNTVRTAPDALVAFGRPKGYRGSYRQWEEAGVAPQVVWEVLSPGNRRGELQEKFEFYERHRVEEYYRYDPDRAELRGWLRRGDALREIEDVQGWVSPRTGVRMRMERRELVLTRPDGQPFLTFLEVMQQREEALAQALEERRQREEAQARAEQERRQREEAQARADEERRQREAAQALTDEERRQRAEAQARAERLAAQLRALGIEPEA